MMLIFRTLDKMNKSRSLPADGLIGFAFTSTSDDVPLRQKGMTSGATACIISFYEVFLTDLSDL